MQFKIKIMKNKLNHTPFAPKLSVIGLTFAFILSSLTLMAQDGNAGIQQATTLVKGYFDTGCSLKWNAGEPDTNKVAAAWFGSCIFLVVVATVIKSFFGL
jgi:hypothetical protein